MSQDDEPPPQGWTPPPPIVMPAPLAPPKPFEMPKPLVVPDLLVAGVAAGPSGPGEGPVVASAVSTDGVVADGVVADNVVADSVVVDGVVADTVVAGDSAPARPATSPGPAGIGWPNPLQAGAARRRPSPVLGCLVLVIALAVVVLAVVAVAGGFKSSSQDSGARSGCVASFGAKMVGGASTPVGNGQVAEIIRRAENLTGHAASCTVSTIRTGYPLGFTALGDSLAPSVLGAVKVAQGEDAGQFPEIVPDGAILGELICVDRVVGGEPLAAARELCEEATGDDRSAVAEWLVTAVPQAMGTDQQISKTIDSWSVTVHSSPSKVSPADDQMVVSVSRQ